MAPTHNRFRHLGGTCLGWVLLAFVATSCEKSAGTYAHVKFEGSTSATAPIARLDLDVTLAEKTTSTFFVSPKPITLPTDATLEISKGEGPIVIVARATTANGQLLGRGQGTGTVKRGTVAIVKITLTPATDPHDAGTSSDSSPLDTRPVTGGRIADASKELPSSGGALGGTDGQVGSGGASGSAKLVFAPEKLDLGNAVIGSKTQAQSILLTNQGVEETGTLTFVIQNPGLFLFVNNPCTGINLLPGASCTLSILFKPSASGAVENTLKISASGITPVEIPLLGTGVGAGTASLSLSPSPKNFGLVDIQGPSVTEQFTVANTGSLSLGPVTVQFEATAPFYKIENDQCRAQNLPPGKTCTFDVRFAPNVVGPAHVNLVVQAEPGASVITPLSGIGRQVFNVVVSTTGNGKGSVKAPGFECAEKTCKVALEWTQPTPAPQITLEANPEPGSVFGGYGPGPCGAEPRCTIRLTSDVRMTAQFNLNSSQQVMFGLTILSLAGHQGVLVVSDGPQSSVCESSCGPETRPQSASITITAKPKEASTFAGWTEGPCKGTQPSCTFALNGNTFISATFGPQSYVFTSSTTLVPSGFGGLAGADDECQRLANKASLPGTYHAWVSSTTEPARTRVGHGGWVRTDGRPFAPSLEALLDATNPVMYYPARLDESGQDLGNKSPWVATGSDTSGNPGTSHCQNFTSALGDINLGDTAMGSRAWSFREPKGSCTSRYRLLCFRADTAAGEIKPPVLPGRRLFVTQSPFTPGSGVGAADEACQGEAKAANLGGSFIAFLSTSAFSARSRITQGRPWKRLDDVFVAKTLDDLVNGNLLAPVGVAVNGITYLTEKVWTGSKNPAQIAIEDTSCQSYMSNLASQQGFVGTSHSTVFPEWFASSLVSCSNPNTHLICIEP